MILSSCRNSIVIFDSSATNQEILGFFSSFFDIHSLLHMLSIFHSVIERVIVHSKLGIYVCLSNSRLCLFDIFFKLVEWICQLTFPICFIDRSLQCMLLRLNRNWRIRVEIELSVSSFKQYCIVLN
jgi:hypothetical protein